MEGSDIISMGWMVLHHSYVRGLVPQQCPLDSRGGSCRGRQDSANSRVQGCRANSLLSFAIGSPRLDPKILLLLSRNHTKSLVLLAAIIKLNSGGKGGQKAKPEADNCRLQKQLVKMKEFRPRLVI